MAGGDRKVSGGIQKFKGPVYKLTCRYKSKAGKGAVGLVNLGGQGKEKSANFLL